MSATAFRFDEATHVYTDLQGRQIPSVTQLLKRAGFIDTTWLTDAGRERGTAVHELTAQYDYGALTDLDGLVSPYRGYVLGWAQAMKLLAHEWTVIEEGIAHPTMKFAGKPDRGGRVFARPACNELKTGAKEAWHGIQTALQCLLLEARLGCPADDIDRYATYIKSDGKFKVEQFKDRTDFARARKLVAEFA
jgi:hypothetical protein